MSFLGQSSAEICELGDGDCNDILMTHAGRKFANKIGRGGGEKLPIEDNTGGWGLGNDILMTRTCRKFANQMGREGGAEGKSYRLKTKLGWLSWGGGREERGKLWIEGKR